MRTPNCQCCICGKPMYRRPGQMARARYVHCRQHRSEALRSAGLTDGQKTGLSLGHGIKGTNNRTGYMHREESKRKTSESHKRWCAANPEKVAARGAKTRGALNCRWKGGSSKLNDSIRRMTENRRWMDAIKERDGQCVRCGSTEDLESHHVKSPAELIENLGITSRDDARKHASVLWNLANGETLCQPCHYAEHGRTYANRPADISNNAV